MVCSWRFVAVGVVEVDGVVEAKGIGAFVGVLVGQRVHALKAANRGVVAAEEGAVNAVVGPQQFVL